MTDYNPRPPPIGPQSGKGGLYLVAGVLVALVLASGLLFFSTQVPGGRSEQASEPNKTLNVPPTAPARPEQPPKE